MGLVCLLFVSMVPPAWAGSGYDQYRRLQAQAKLYKNLGRPARAAQALIDAYAQYPDEIVLLDAVQLYREASEHEKALRLAERYMRIGRAPAGRVNGRKHITELRNTLSTHSAELEVITAPNNAWLCLQRPGVPEQDCLPGPLLRWLKEGTLVIHATTKSGVHRKYQHEVKPGKHVRITIPIELPVPRGRLDIFSPENGQAVSVDGVVRGKTPLTGLEVTAGPHIVSVLLTDQESWRSDVTVKPGHTTTVYAGRAPPDSPASATRPVETAQKLPVLPPVRVVARRPKMPKRTSEAFVVTADDSDGDTAEPVAQTTPTETSTPVGNETDDDASSAETDDFDEDDTTIAALPLPTQSDQDLDEEGDDDVAVPAPIPDEDEDAQDDDEENVDTDAEPNEPDDEPDDEPEDALKAMEEASDDDENDGLPEDDDDSDPKVLDDDEDEDDEPITDMDSIDDNDDDSDDEAVATLTDSGGAPWQSVTGWTSIGIGGAAVAGAIATGVLAMMAVDEANGLDAKAPDYASQFKQRKESAEFYGLLTNIIMPAGGALIAAGVTLLLLSPDGDTQPSIALDDTHRLRFNAVPQRSGVMIHTTIDF